MQRLLHVPTCGTKIFFFLLQKKDCLAIPSSFRMNNISRHIFMHKKSHESWICNSSFFSLSRHSRVQDEMYKNYSSTGIKCKTKKKFGYLLAKTIAWNVLKKKCAHPQQCADFFSFFFNFSFFFLLSLNMQIRRNQSQLRLLLATKRTLADLLTVFKSIIQSEKVTPDRSHANDICPDWYGLTRSYVTSRCLSVNI